ncbi:hypothetical protein NESM_000751800 [Novymonas esmeraldas]|uniref:Uncharacterized protein n=1 Tax=Novymonas esmeraldas TaxID=1808958 RepID=A0AAW0EV00_9TRYP
MHQTPSCRQVASPAESESVGTAARAPLMTERQLAGDKSRERLRRDRERQLRQLPFLYHRVEALQDTCERLEHELATSRQRVAAFQQETFALRTLVKFAERPELAAAAEKEAVRLVLQEEVRQLRQCVQRLEREKELSLRQSEEACDAAEFYKRLCDQLYTESINGAADNAGGGAPQYVETVTAPPPRGQCSTAPRTTATAVAAAVAPMEEQMRQLHGALEFERARSSALEETVCLLQAAVAEASTAASRPSTSAPQTPREMDERHSSRSAGDVRGSHESRPRLHADEAHRSATRMKRLVAVLRAENRLLTQRVAEVVARNTRCVKDIASLKLASKQLALPPPQGL